jgi:hypothetical protein
MHCIADEINESSATSVVAGEEGTKARDEQVVVDAGVKVGPVESD